MTKMGIRGIKKDEEVEKFYIQFKGLFISLTQYVMLCPTKPWRRGAAPPRRRTRKSRRRRRRSRRSRRRSRRRRTGAPTPRYPVGPSLAEPRHDVPPRRLPPLRQVLGPQRPPTSLTPSLFCPSELCSVFEKINRS